MQEFRDGSFGAIEPAREILDRLSAGIPADMKSVHFGTPEDLELVKKDANTRLDVQGILNKIGELESRINEATIEKRC